MDGSKFRNTIFKKGSPKEHSCEIISKSGQQFHRRRFFSRISSCQYSARSPHSSEPCWWTDQNFACSFLKGSTKEHSCEIISKSDKRFQSRRLLKNCLKIPFRYHGNHSFRWNQILWPVLKEDLPRNNPAKFSPDWPCDWEGEVV